MRIFFFILLVLKIQICNSQNSGKIWYFGDQAGLDFRGSWPQPIFDNRLYCTDGSSVVCDENDRLLFYTNGEEIRNRIHNIMLNGSGLLGSNDCMHPSTVIKVSDYDSVFYYVFTNDNLGGLFGLNYSVVDMNKQQGLGGVIRWNIFIRNNLTEKLLAIPHINHCETWLICHELGSARFLAYPVSITGVGSPVISDVGSIQPYGIPAGEGAQGQISASPDGKMIAMASYSLDEYQLFNFDRATGKLSNPITLGPYSKPWGVEFSPDNKKLYATRWTFPYVYQFDLSVYNQDSINDSSILLGSVTGDDPVYTAGALSLGPDDKIYIAIWNTRRLASIEWPNLAGTSCNLSNSGEYLWNNSLAGLPYFTKFPFDTAFTKSLASAQVLGNDTMLCFPGKHTLSVNISNPLWSNNSRNQAIAIVKPGSYWVRFEDCNTIYSDTIHIADAHCPPPDAPDSCTLACSKIGWANWTRNSDYSFDGSLKFGQIATMYLDSASALPIRLFPLELTNPMFKPQTVPIMPTPFMPGNAVHTLRHKIKLKVNKVEDIILLISSVPNSKQGFSSLQHTRIRAYDSLGNQLDVSNVKFECEDFTTYNLSRTKINISANEIDLTVDNAINLNEGSALFFSNFPPLTSYIIVEHNDDQSYIWDSIFLSVGIPDCPAENCEQACKKIDWSNWQQKSGKKYSGTMKRGSVTLDFDPLIGTSNSGLYNVTLASAEFIPKNIDSMPTPFMPGAPGVTKLIHKLQFDSIVKPSEALILVGEFPNESNPVFSKQQTGKLRAYDKMNNQLELPDVCQVFQDPLASMIFSPTILQINTNEITFSVDHPSGADGGLVILKGFPNNTHHFEIEHFDELSANWDGIYINAGLHDCCETNGQLTYNFIQCKGDTLYYTFIGAYSFTNPPESGFVIVRIDSGYVQTFNPPLSLPLDIHIPLLPADGKVHTITITTSDFPDCFQTFTYTAPLPNREPQPKLIFGDSIFCERDSLRLFTNPYTRYTWTGPMNNSWSEQNLVVPLFNNNLAGKYFLTIRDFDGCVYKDSINISVLRNPIGTKLITACDSFTINGKTYTKNGSYVQLKPTGQVCDSFITISLFLKKSSVHQLNLNSCQFANINGVRYDQTGNYKQVFISANGCDSILNINFKHLDSTSSQLNLSSCDSVVVNGQTYSQAGDYRQFLKNVNGCDSILNIHFNILTNTSTNLVLSSCDSVVVNAQTYKQTGNYTQIIPNANGCDSLINIHYTQFQNSSEDLVLSTCDSGIVNGVVYTRSGKFMQLLKNTNDCDSTLNIQFTNLPESFSIQQLTACDSAVINGKTFKNSTTYQSFLNNAIGCDSIISTDLIILKSSTSNLILMACDSIIVNALKYTMSDTSQQILINSDGCDSILNLDLTINSAIAESLEAGKDTSICDGETFLLNGSYKGQANFFWKSNGGTFDQTNVLQTHFYPNAIGTHLIYLSSVNECGQLLDSITIHVLPKQNVQVTGDTIIDPCKEITFTASGGNNYTWTPASLIECIDPACKTVRLKPPGTITFTITTDGPCVEPASLNLSTSQVQSELYVPNIFSPNGDNINDHFLPVIQCDRLEYYNLQIFDRWGNLLFASSQKEIGWNGKYQSENVNPGVFSYVIQYQLPGGERRMRSGDVSLIR